MLCFWDHVHHCYLHWCYLLAEASPSVSEISFCLFPTCLPLPWELPSVGLPDIITRSYGEHERWVHHTRQVPTSQAKASANVPLAKPKRCNSSVRILSSVNRINFKHHLSLKSWSLLPQETPNRVQMWLFRSKWLRAESLLLGCRLLPSLFWSNWNDGARCLLQPPSWLLLACKTHSFVQARGCTSGGGGKQLLPPSLSFLGRELIWCPKASAVAERM